MNNKVKDIALGIVCLFIPSVFVWAMIHWPEYGKKDGWMGNLYYLTVSATMYVLSVIVHIAARTPFWEVCSCVGLAVFGMNLYIEFFKDPRHWSRFDMAMIWVVAINLFGVVLLKRKFVKR